MQASDNDLIKNISKLHTTELGAIRIKRNLSLETDDVIKWCKEQIISMSAAIIRKGKNWYVENNRCEITINAYSYTVITAHKIKT